MNNRKYAIGSIYSTKIAKNEYIPVKIEDIKECSYCWGRHLCIGGCVAQKISTGQFNNTAQLPDKCDLDKLLFEFYLKFFYYLKTVTPEYFKTESEEQNE
jgi:sulfatase maturation enzyme AslB (radical SAM superfamily)